MGNMGKRQRAICMTVGFLEGTALCRWQVPAASFFLPETRFFGDWLVADGKRIRRENICCQRLPSARSSMSRAPRRFLVRCRCSADVAVTAGQAGEQISCPACGNPIAVPRLRDLEQFLVAVPSAAAPRPWNAAHGCVLAGVAVAALAALAAASTPLFGGRSLTPIVPDDVIRATVIAADDADVYPAWRALCRSGVSRLATDDEVRRQLFTRSTGSLAGIFWGIAAVGAALAAVGGVMLVRSAPRLESRP